MGLKKGWMKGELECGKSGMGVVQEWEKDKEKWVWIIVYRNGAWKDLKQDLVGWMEERVDGKNVNLMITGDFNARIGIEGGGIRDDGEGGGRNSKDKSPNWEGKNLLQWLEENGLEVLNGNWEGDWEGEFTYVGHMGSTVVDYGIVNGVGKDKIKQMCVGKRVESDHQPVIMVVEGRSEEEHIGEGEEERKYLKEYAWTEHNIKEYKEKLRKGLEKGGSNGSVEEKWQEIKDIIGMARKRVEGYRGCIRDGKSGGMRVVG